MLTSRTISASTVTVRAPLAVEDNHTITLVRLSAKPAVCVCTVGTCGAVFSACRLLQDCIEALLRDCQMALFA